MYRAGLILVLGLTFGAVPANAETRSETVFSKLNWVSKRVEFDSGAIGCVADGASTDNSVYVSLWRFKDKYNLQFYSESWDFGEGNSADITIQIDSKPVWNLVNSDLHKNSIIFYLPTENKNSNVFISEIKGGTNLVLNGDGLIGNRIFALNGASDAIRYIELCKF